jgi:hypothetical protein
LKNPTTKKVGGVVQGVSPEFKSQYCKKKKKIFKLNAIQHCGEKFKKN